MNITKEETHKRSIIKSILWRIIGVIILAIVTYAFTKNLITTGLITFIHHGIAIFAFYLHERIWLRIIKLDGIKRKLAKMFIYETLFGFIILGTITYLITGNWKTTTTIPIIYISIKHICYILNEMVWDRIKYGVL